LQLVRQQAGVDIPLAVGFGISNPDQAAKISAMADGAIVGSAVIKVMEQYLGHKDMVERVGQFVGQLNTAVKSKI
jgi:tryptophan synthase alpha chain